MADLTAIQEAAARRRRELKEAGLDPDEVERAELAAAMTGLGRSLVDATGSRQLAEWLGSLHGFAPLVEGLTAGAQVKSIAEQAAGMVRPPDWPNATGMAAGIMTESMTDAITGSFAADLAQRLGALGEIGVGITGNPFKELGEYLAGLTTPQLTGLSRQVDESAATILGDSLQRMTESIQASNLEAFQAAAGTFERAHEALSEGLRAHFEPPVFEPTPEMGRALFDQRARELLGISGEEFLRRWDAGEFSAATDEPERPELVELVALMPFARAA